MGLAHRFMDRHLNLWSMVSTGFEWFKQAMPHNRIRPNLKRNDHEKITFYSKRAPLMLSAGWRGALFGKLNDVSHLDIGFLYFAGRACDGADRAGQDRAATAIARLFRHHGSAHIPWAGAGAGIRG